MSTPQWGNGGVGPELTELGPWDTLTLGGIKLPGLALCPVAHRGRKKDRKSPAGADGETYTDQGSKAAEIDITIVLWTAAQMDQLRAALDRIMPVPKKAGPASSGVTYTESGLLTTSGAPAGVWDPLGDTNLFPQTVSADQPGPYPVALAINDSLTTPTLAPATPGNASGAVSISHPALDFLRIRSVIIDEIHAPKPGRKRGTYEVMLKTVEWLGKGKTKVVSTANASASPGSVPVASGLPVDDPSTTDVDP